jgi:hypothetical protein
LPWCSDTGTSLRANSAWKLLRPGTARPARGSGPLLASKVKQYLKEGRAPRTETTVNDTYDFGIGRPLTAENWDALVRVGHNVNQRLLDAQLQACACAPDAVTLERVVLPASHDGSPAHGLRFGDPRVMALKQS